MKQHLFLLSAFMIAFNSIIFSQQTSNKPDRENWFMDLGFGMFIHWGLYSQLAGEWNVIKTERNGEWIMLRLNIPVEEYEKVT